MKRIEPFIKNWGVHLLLVPLVVAFGVIYMGQDKVVTKAKQEKGNVEEAEGVKGTTDEGQTKVDSTEKNPGTKKVDVPVVVSSQSSPATASSKVEVQKQLGTPSQEESKESGELHEAEVIESVTLTIKGLGVFEVEIQDGDTALSILRRTSAKYGFALDIVEDPNWGAFINGIGGVVSEDPYYWFLYYNGAESYEGASFLKVFDNDKIEWRYKSWL